VPPTPGGRGAAGSDAAPGSRGASGPAGRPPGGRLTALLLTLTFVVSLLVAGGATIALATRTPAVHADEGGGGEGGGQGDGGQGGQGADGQDGQGGQGADAGATGDGDGGDGGGQAGRAADPAGSVSMMLLLMNERLARQILEDQARGRLALAIDPAPAVGGAAVATAGVPGDEPHPGPGTYATIPKFSQVRFREDGREGGAVQLSDDQAGTGGQPSPEDPARARDQAPAAEPPAVEPPAERLPDGIARLLEKAEATGVDGTTTRAPTTVTAPTPVATPTPAGVTTPATTGDLATASVGTGRTEGMEGTRMVGGTGDPVGTGRTEGGAPGEPGPAGGIPVRATPLGAAPAGQVLQAWRANLGSFHPSVLQLEQAIAEEPDLRLAALGVPLPPEIPTSAGDGPAALTVSAPGAPPAFLASAAPVASPAPPTASLSLSLSLTDPPSLPEEVVADAGQGGTPGLSTVAPATDVMPALFDEAGIPALVAPSYKGLWLAVARDQPVAGALQPVPVVAGMAGLPRIAGDFPNAVYQGVVTGDPAAAGVELGPGAAALAGLPPLAGAVPKAVYEMTEDQPVAGMMELVAPAAATWLGWSPVEAILPRAAWDAEQTDMGAGAMLPAYVVGGPWAAAAVSAGPGVLRMAAEILPEPLDAPFKFAADVTHDAVKFVSKEVIGGALELVGLDKPADWVMDKAKDAVRDVGSFVGDVAKDVVKGVGKAVKAVGKFLGGLF